MGPHTETEVTMSDSNYDASFDRDFDRKSGGKGGGAVNAAAGDDSDLPIGTIFKLIVVLALLALIVIFVLQNLDNVPVDFLQFSFEAPLVLLLLAAAVVGVIVRWTFGFVRSRR